MIGAPLRAQEALEAQTGEPPETIDILVDTAPQGPEYEDCSEEQEAAAISGEIVVCRRKSGEENRLYSNEEAQDRHAERTKGPMPMDVNLKNDIPMVGVGVTFKGCFIPPCPKPMPILIDLKAIPEAPPGSDADRVGRGLAPLGRDGPAGSAVRVAGEQPSAQDNAAQLGLPPPLGEEAVSPSGSASPAEAPSG